MAALVESMFSVKEVPWHKQGEILTDYPDTATAYCKSGLNWTVEKKPMFYFCGEQQIQSQDYAIVRSSDNSQLGTCRDRYNLFQNEEGFTWCDPLVESGYWRYETAGALKQGQVGWILLKQGEVELVDRDKINQYLLLTWAHDGRTSIQPMTTAIRVVCNNTLTAALNEAADKHYVLHNATMHMRLEQIRALYLSTKAQFEAQTEAFSKMLDVKMSEGQTNKLVDMLMDGAYGLKNIDDMEEGRAKTNALRIRSTLLDGAFNSTGAKELGIDGTLYSVFNGIEEAVEHSIGGKRIQDRGNNILFGNGRRVVDIAFKQAMALVA